MRMPTMRQRGFAKQYAAEIDSGNLTPKSAAVYSQVVDVPTSYAYDLARNGIVQDLIRVEVAKLNTPHAIALNIRAMRKAKRGIYYEGAHVADEPDWTARSAGISLTLKALNIGEQAAIDARTVNFNIGTMQPDQIQKIADTLEKLNASLALPDKV